MKKFSFKLDKLMSFKEQTLDNERMALAALQSEMERARARLNAFAAVKEKNEAELEEKQGKGELSPLEYQLHYKYDTYLKEEISAAKQIIAHLQAKIDMQVELIKEIKLEAKSLETVRNSKLAIYRKEEVKSAELLLDEFVNTASLMRRVSM